ncbi:MAG TPA: transporter substrate-binding domain-containing protein [Paenalcaligenes hominis]|uniref:Octopine/nopaline transport system substrate-binding protein n=1 Tax=Paenalcaligenes hominis TaxID=643674 RepID=A0A9D2VFL6_9BURK|nr:transporter substrate-binding domain-containing protein [Paenalcaligenes hominis]NJB65493.1 octopine/nopaline transport system substrate-binding protein [Paenalcaligenes hominis]GGE65417.1 amino acid ABC transporter substrate-binding protein [Paenalcaligenes hominis]HJH23837.1 transporter substrate-binding domain-containing protein [Paenalcaligenes hominis]
MNIKKTLIGAGLALFSVATLAATSYKIGTEGGYPPWSMVDAAGTVTGFDADVGAALCKQLDADCQFTVQSFDSLIPSLSANRFDLIISGMSYTPERAKRINFSLPYAVEDAIFILKNDADGIKAGSADAIYDSLEGKTIGVQGGTTHGAFLAKVAPKVTIKDYETLDQMQIDLDAGRLDGTFADLTSQSRFLKQMNNNDFALTETVIKGSSDPEVLGYGIAIGIHKDKTDLKEKVDAALCKLIEDGTIKTASQKWFDIDITNYDACK